MAVERVHVDADVMIRLLTGDDPLKQECAAALFKRAEQGGIELCSVATTLFDVYFVLTSNRLYRFTRETAVEAIKGIVQLGNLQLDNMTTIMAALDLVAETKSLGDAHIVASMRTAGIGVLYSYDRGFDRFADLVRREPEQPPATPPTAGP